MTAEFILAFDQGTTSSRSILFDAEGRAVASASEPLPQHFPKPGWVEHEAEDIFQTQLATAKRVMKDARIEAAQIAAIGITNQRETALVWERATGKPIHRAIVWQCRRTAPACEALARSEHMDEIRRRTGLVADAYFSGTKVAWLLDNVPGARERAERGELCFGTVDAWLLMRLAGRHATDPSNASRTMLFNIHTGDWDDDLLNWLHVPRAMLPELVPTGGVCGATTLLGGEIPIASMVGDQQGALFGQTAFHPGEGKCTYGTGAFLLVNTGGEPRPSHHGLLSTVAWRRNSATTYALEGSVFIAGAVVQWLRDEMGLIQTAEESAALAASVPDTHGVVVVPAFTGLGAPHWDMRARGIITGLTRGASRAHIVRAALESVAHQAADVLKAMESDLGGPIASLRVDGGASRNDLLMQMQADLLGRPVIRGEVSETTALGAAYLAGLAVGLWKSEEELRLHWKVDREFEPQITADERAQRRTAWAQAVRMARAGEG